MNHSIINQLITAFEEGQILTNEAVKERYHHIWHMDESLHAKAIVLPKSTQEVAKAMKICNDYNQPVIVYGGLTNLVGSTETNGDEVIISMEKLNRIEEVDGKSRTMTVEAGVILENVQNAASEIGLLFPLNYGAKGSAQVGGALSTNAGGLRVFRFGMARNLVLGLEAVLANGTIISSLKKIIKDNSAYDLKQLFIGSEGTLGVITKAVLKLVEAPKSRNSAFVAFNEYEDVIRFLKYMDAGLAGTLSGYELIWGNTYKKMTSPPALAKPPLPHGYNYYVLLESLGGNQEKDRQALQDLLEQAFEKELLADGVLAHTESDLNWFWTIREDVHVINSQCVFSQHFDVSLPIPQIGNYVQQVYEQLGEIPELNNYFAFGHVADGNIHFILDKNNKSSSLTNQVNDIIYAPLKALGGSVSAEHGIGKHKKAYLPFCRTDEEIQLMKTLKKAMDPKGILNPGKVL
jgi:FAD/FMN-containing dehydrogenase